MNPFYFKLVNGDEIMANVIDEDENHYTIDYPFKFINHQNPSTGYLATTLIRWVPMQSFMVTPLRVKKSTVITEGPLEDSVIKYYAHVRLQTSKEIEEDDEDVEIVDYASEDEENFSEFSEEEYDALEEDALEELTNPNKNTTVH